MGNDQNRYAQMEKLMTLVIMADLFLFILYFIFAALGIVWMKVILTILVIAVSGCTLGFLYISKELTKPRSVWMTTAATAMVFCLLFSLILNYPN